jgi:cysteine desulfurase
MGLPPDRARASLRFSFGKHNTADDLDLALSVLPGVVAHLRELSPLYAKSGSQQGPQVAGKAAHS